MRLYLDGADRERLDPILDRCVAAYLSDLDEDGQVRFKGTAKAFARAYAFLSSILPYNNLDWEERSIFLDFLIPKLPAPEEPDLSKGILERIDMDSYRVEKHEMRKIMLEDADAEIDPVGTGEGGGRGEVETDRLSAIIEEFNDQIQRRRAVVVVDSGREYAGTLVGGRRVQIVGRREAPTGATHVEETMIPQVIVRVRDQDIEYHPPPERAKISSGRGAAGPEDIGDFEIGAPLVVACPQHAHRREKGHSQRVRPVESPHDQHPPPGHLLDAPVGDFNSGPVRQR